MTYDAILVNTSQPDQVSTLRDNTGISTFVRQRTSRLQKQWHAGDGPGDLSRALSIVLYSFPVSIVRPTAPVLLQG